MRASRFEEKPPMLTLSPHLVAFVRSTPGEEPCVGGTHLGSLEERQELWTDRHANGNSRHRGIGSQGWIESSCSPYRTLEPRCNRDLKEESLLDFSPPTTTSLKGSWISLLTTQWTM